MKTIKLGYISGKYTDKNEYINIDEDLIVQIEHKFDNCVLLGNVYMNGVLINKKKIENNTLIIPRNNIKTGKLSIEIEVYVNNMLMRTTKVEDLTILRENGKLKSVPEFDKLREDFEENSKLVNSYKKDVEDLTKEVKKLTKLVGVLYEMNRVGANE